MPKGEPVEHGTVKKYRALCRCDACRIAWASYCREEREKRSKVAPKNTRLKHGSISTYNNWGCRCDKCKAAAKTYRHANSGGKWDS